jgi:HEPN domain-containing protein
LAAIGNRNAAYLCQQAAEKLIRAVCTSEGRHAGRGHQLDEMIDLLPDENPLKSVLRQVETLAAYATTFRYPTSTRVLSALSDGELATYIARIEALLEEAVRRFDVELDKKGTPARAPNPIR